MVSLSRRRAIVACARAAGTAAAAPVAKARIWKIDKAILICAAALALAPEGAGFGSATGATASGRTAEATEAAPRYLVAYSRWRSRLQRHDLFVGRDLLAEARSADGFTRPPTERELRRSIGRMKARWSRWLQTTAEGRSVAFRLKVRHRVPGWGRASLRSIAACESHNNPRAVGGGGIYRGLYQFSFSTWRAVGGSGDPAAASRWEQTWRAWLLLSRHGAGHWPICG